MSAEPDHTDSAAAPGQVRASSAVSSRRFMHGFRALSYRNYRLFWFGQVISLVGTWMQTTAQAWLVLKLTGSALSLGTVTALQFLPVTLLALHGGVLTDRLRKHRALVFTQSASMIQAFIFGLLVATGMIHLWHIYILAVVLGLINAIDTPIRLAFAVEMVGREDLSNAVALNSTGFNLARVVGPPIAGFMMDTIGIAPTLFLNAFSFIAVLIGLLMMHPSELFTVQPTQRASVNKHLREGLSYARHSPVILTILITIGFLGTFGYNFTIVLPLIAEFVLHTSATGFGSLGSFLGFGSLIAALAVAYLSKPNMGRVLIGAGAFSLLLGMIAFSQVFVLSGVLLGLLGFAGIVFVTSANTLLQLSAPDELRGRIMSVYVLLFIGSTPIGSYLTGVMSDLFGVQAALLICATVSLIGVGVAAIYYRRSRPVKPVSPGPG